MVGAASGRDHALLPWNGASPARSPENIATSTVPTNSGRAQAPLQREIAYGVSGGGAAAGAGASACFNAR